MSKVQLARMFERAGHEVRSRAAHRPHWLRDLSNTDVVVVVGGDGTVAKIAIALAARRSPPPLAVIPAGKANNIARALGSPTSASRLATGLAGARSARLSIGLIRSPWGTARFVESAGIGPLASLFQVDLPTLRAGLRFLRAAFRIERAKELRVRVDNRDVHGHYVMLHVMNIDAVGPRLVYAPGANPGDDRLELVLLDEARHRTFNRYLDRLAAGRYARCPIVPIRARAIEIWPWPAKRGGHIDDKIWPATTRPQRGRVRITVETSIPVLVPRA